MLRKNNRLKQQEQLISHEVSVKSNLVRTAILVGLTIFFMGLIRFSSFLSHIMQHIAGMGWWQSLYDMFHIETALGREQLLLVAIVLFCFVLALFVQFLGIFLIGKMRGYLSHQRGEERDKA